jgi:hypothetical protein
MILKNKFKEFWKGINEEGLKTFTFSAVITMENGFKNVRSSIMVVAANENEAEQDVRDSIERDFKHNGKVSIDIRRIK